MALVCFDSFVMAHGQCEQHRLVKIAKLKTRQFTASTCTPVQQAMAMLHACVYMALSIQIAKFKIHQYQLRALLPNL